MLLYQLLSLLLEFILNSALLLRQLLVNSELVLLNLLRFLIPCLFVVLKLHLAALLLVIELNSLTYFFLHVFEHEVAVKGDFSQPVLILDLELFLLNIDFLLVLLFED